mmetsp:Transcript_10784/g.21093  ORF Transcript_10784/g.21093 Transcript_10784/m.21093 type:complete len:82 (-) Transcript_10784:1385-1630(-)
MDIQVPVFELNVVVSKAKVPDSTRMLPKLKPVTVTDFKVAVDFTSRKKSAVRVPCVILAFVNLKLAVEVILPSAFKTIAFP